MNGARTVETNHHVIVWPSENTYFMIGIDYIKYHPSLRSFKGRKYVIVDFSSAYISKLLFSNWLDHFKKMEIILMVSEQRMLSLAWYYKCLRHYKIHIVSINDSGIIRTEKKTKITHKKNVLSNAELYVIRKSLLQCTPKNIAYTLRLTCKDVYNMRAAALKKIGYSTFRELISEVTVTQCTGQICSGV